MSETLKVIVCDDDDDRARDWADRINDSIGHAVDATALESDEFGAAVAALKERKAYAKLHKTLPLEQDPALKFDNADVVVLDSDLTPDSGLASGGQLSDVVQQHLVGELGGEVAHLARCYSKAGALMVVNQKWKRRSFDLTMMAFSSDVADVYVSETDLDNRGLWSIPLEPNSFRPWSWPLLAALPSAMELLCHQVSIEAPVLSTLGLDDAKVIAAFTDRQLDALGIENWETMTFDDVAQEGEFGLRLKETVEPEQRLRIAVYGVRRWLERHVLPSHNVIVDAPHLFQRRPWAHPDRENHLTWNNSENWFTDSAVALPPLDPSPSSYAATLSTWLGRHVWLAPVAAQDQRAADHRILPTDPVFCEDTSTFVAADEAIDFISDLEGASGQRFVKSMPIVDYHPRRRLLT